MAIGNHVGASRRDPAATIMASCCSTGVPADDQAACSCSLYISVPGRMMVYASGTDSLIMSLQPIISWYLYVSSFLCLNSRYYNFRFPPFSEHHHKIGCKIKNTRTFYSCRKLRDLQSYVLNRMNIVHCSFNNTPFGGSDRLAKITSLCGKVSDGDVGLANWHLLMYASPVHRQCIATTS